MKNRERSLSPNQDSFRPFTFEGKSYIYIGHITPPGMVSGHLALQVKDGCPEYDVAFFSDKSVMQWTVPVKLPDSPLEKQRLAALQRLNAVLAMPLPGMGIDMQVEWGLL